MSPQSLDAAAQGFLQKTANYLEPKEQTLVARALDIAVAAHAGYVRQSGAAYALHAIAVANMLAGWRAPTAVIIAGLLHDIRKNHYAKAPPMENIEAEFGAEIASLVNEVARLGRLGDVYANLDLQQPTDNMEAVARQMPWAAIALRRMPLAVVIKLADRLHNFQDIEVLPQERQINFANRVLNLFVPFAERLGMRHVKRQLEDHAFQILQPDDFAKIQTRYPEAKRHAATAVIIQQIQQQLAHYQLKAEVRCQPRSWYELYKREAPSHELLPLIVMQPILIIVDSFQACYQSLGMVHGLWPPQLGKIIDTIAAPRPNGYRALHTYVNYESGNMLQMIIRERQMHRVAEYGVTADWLGAPTDLLPELPAWKAPPPGKIAVFSKDGDQFLLPEQATPIDFAYRVHPNVGHNSTGARVNGRLVPLSRPLEDGDVVEILLGRASVGPSPEWLSHVKTAKARRAIRRWLQIENPGKVERKGMNILDRLLRREGILLSTSHALERLTAVAAQMGYGSRRDLLIAIGLEQRNPEPVVEQMKMPPKAGQRPLSLQATIVSLTATSSQGHRLAGCCDPTPPDPIVAFVTNRKEVVIHRSDCLNVIEKRPLHSAEWNTTGIQQTSEIEIIALDRSGLVRDISAVPAEMNIAMVSFQADQMEDNSARVQIGLGPLKAEDIDIMIKQLKRVSSVRTVEHHAPTRPTRLTQGSIQARRFTNPYTLSPVTGHNFYGRRDELRELVNNLRDLVPGKAVLLWGPRRIGKTSLLLEFQRMVSSDDYLVAFVDMQRLSNRSTTIFLYEILNAITREMTSGIKPPRLRRVRRDALGYFRSFLENNPILRDKHLILILDEFQLLSTLRQDELQLSDINIYFRSLIQHRTSLSIVFSGGGVKNHLLHQAEASFMLEVVQEQQIGCLQRDDARQLIVEPVQRVQYDPQTVEQLLDLTAGHPYYLQMVCAELIKRADPTQEISIAQPHIEHLLNEWLPLKGEQFFNHLWGSFSGFKIDVLQLHKLALTAIAALSHTNRWVSFDEITNTAVNSIIPAEQLWHILKDLVNMDTLLFKEPESYCIKVALFEQWLRQNYSISMLVKELTWVKTRS